MKTGSQEFLIHLSSEFVVSQSFSEFYGNNCKVYKNNCKKDPKTIVKQKHSWILGVKNDLNLDLEFFSSKMIIFQA
jgi:hypothetical protein